jgi:hypothetical protein
VDAAVWDGRPAGSRGRVNKGAVMRLAPARRPWKSRGSALMESAKHLFDVVVHFLKRGGLWWGVGISVTAAVVTLALATVVVVGWPADRFKGEGPTEVGRDRHVVIRALAIVAKNLAGAVLVLLGLIMALPGVPGQGLLTALIGLTLLSFPGKRRLERRFVKVPALLRAINRVRARFARPPLELD